MALSIRAYWPSSCCHLGSLFGTLTEQAVSPREFPGKKQMADKKAIIHNFMATSQNSECVKHRRAERRKVPRAAHSR
jgi:hypothetical protein